MKRRRGKASPQFWMDWTPEIAAMFDDWSVLTEGMTPPSRVRVYRGHRHLTVLARFTRVSAYVVTCKLKVPLPQKATGPVNLASDANRFPERCEVDVAHGVVSAPAQPRFNTPGADPVPGGDR